jgi:hypothetical protein
MHGSRQRGRDLHSPIEGVTDRYPAGRSDKQLYDGLSLPPPSSIDYGSPLRQGPESHFHPHGVIAWKDRATERRVAFGLGRS